MRWILPFSPFSSPVLEPNLKKKKIYTVKNDWNFLYATKGRQLQVNVIQQKARTEMAYKNIFKSAHTILVFFFQI